MTNQVLQDIDNIVKNNEIVLFMKGNKDMPQCGFSATVVSILQKLNTPFKDVNVMESMEIRQGIKDYTDWPTIPQLYIKGEFVGGCDIVREMYESGELQNLLQSR